MMCFTTVRPRPSWCCDNTGVQWWSTRIILVRLGPTSSWVMQTSHRSSRTSSDPLCWRNQNPPQPSHSYGGSGGNSLRGRRRRSSPTRHNSQMARGLVRVRLAARSTTIQLTRFGVSFVYLRGCKMPSHNTPHKFLVKAISC